MDFTTVGGDAFRERSNGLKNQLKQPEARYQHE